MSIRPVAVVVCSISHQSGAAALEALELGAVDFVQKPTALATDRVFEIADELILKVKAAATAVLQSSVADGVSQASTVDAGESARADKSTDRAATRADIVVIGISTGGPQALRQLIPRLPADLPVPVAVVLHMPVGYTAMYAQRLNEISSIEVREATGGELIRAGCMYLAPAGHHLTFVAGPNGTVCTHLDLKPSETAHRPSVDVLFRSAAEVYGSRVVGVVMTGMGNDGMVGAAHIQARGGRVLTEHEASCVVYGMPRAVVEAGMSDRVATLGDMASTILEMI